MVPCDRLSVCLGHELFLKVGKTQPGEGLKFITATASFYELREFWRAVAGRHQVLCLLPNVRVCVCVWECAEFKSQFFSKVIFFCRLIEVECHQLIWFTVILKFVYKEFMNIRYSLLLWFQHNMIIIIMIIAMIICPSIPYYCYYYDDLKCNMSLCVFGCVNIQ